MKKVIFLTSQRNKDIIENHISLTNCYDVEVISLKNWDISDFYRTARILIKRVCDDVDGIVAMNDFAALLVGYIKIQKDLSAASLLSVMRIQNKYFSRILQKSVAPDSVPQFFIFEKQVGLEAPFFLKPVYSALSAFAMRCQNLGEAKEHVRNSSTELQRRNDIYARLFHIVHSEFKVSEDLSGSFIAESLIPEYEQITTDGYVYMGETMIIGHSLSTFLEESLSFDTFQFPKKYSEHIERKLYKLTCKLVRVHGLDNTFFNIEYRVDVKSEEIYIVEINSRTSSQFSYMISEVTGFDMLKGLADLAVGIDPGFVPRLSIPRYAVNFILRRVQDGYILNLPEAKVIQKIESRHSQSRITFTAKEGHRLSEYAQDTDSFRYGFVDVFGVDYKDAYAQFKEIYTQLHAHVQFKDVN